MTRTISLISAVAGLALVLTAPAFGKGQPVPADFWNYDEQGQKVMNTSPGLSADELAGLYDAEQSSLSASPIVSPDAIDRAVAARMTEGRSLVFDNHRSAGANGDRLGPVISPDAFERAVTARETAGRGLGFDNYKIEPPSTVIVTGSTTSSGREVEWPQLGIGFAIGLVLALGLGMALRALHVRQLAH